MHAASAIKVIDCWFTGTPIGDNSSQTKMHSSRNIKNSQKPIINIFILRYYVWIMKLSKTYGSVYLVYFFLVLLSPLCPNFNLKKWKLLIMHFNAISV